MQRRSLGDRRGALSAARLALPHVDPARNQGPCPPARPHPQECGLFRGRAPAGWALCVLSGNRANSNGPSFLQFLQQLCSASRGTRRRVVVITDNARYHHARLHRPWREQHAITLLWISFPRTVPNSIRSSECGSSHAVVACTSATSPISKTSSAR
jgi:hypothetical protein